MLVRSSSRSPTHALLVKPELEELVAYSDETGFVVSRFGSEVAKDFCESFMAKQQDQAIGELEATAVAVAFEIEQHRSLCGLFGRESKSLYMVCSCAVGGQCRRLAIQMRES